MHKFTCVADIGDLPTAVAEAMEIKRDRFQFTGLGRNKTLLMLFFNSSLQAPWLTSNTMTFMPRFIAAFCVESRVRRLELKNSIRRV